MKPASTVNSQQSTGPAVRSEHGVALLLAISGLATLGVITLTGLILARGERDTGLAALARVQARGAALAAMAEALLGWPSSQTPSAPGSVAPLSFLSVPGPAYGAAAVRALGGPVYLLEATGARLSQSGDTLGSVRMELLVLLSPPDSNSNIHPRSYPRGWRLLP